VNTLRVQVRQNVEAVRMVEGDLGHIVYSFSNNWIKICWSIIRF